jgi:hypothetical protein
MLGSIIALDKRKLAAGNLLHLLARGYVPEPHLLGGTCGVSTLAMPTKLIMKPSRPSRQDWADKHRAVAPSVPKRQVGAAADDVQTIVIKLNALHST